MNTRAQGPSDFRFTAFDFDTANFNKSNDGDGRVREP